MWSYGRNGRREIHIKQDISKQWNMAGKEKQPWNDQHPSIRVKWISTCGRCWFSASCTPSSGLKPRHNPCKTITDVSNSFPYIAKRSPDITFSSHSLLLVISGFLRSRPSGTRMVSISSKSLINGKYTKLANIVNVDAIHSKLLSFFCFKFSPALYFWNTQDNFFSFSVCNPLQFSSYYDFHILPDHDRHPSAISPRMPSLELHFRHRKCSPLYFWAPPFPTCLFPHAGGKYFVTCFCIQEMLSENQLLMKTMPKAQRTWGIE